MSYRFIETITSRVWIYPLIVLKVYKDGFREACKREREKLERLTASPRCARLIKATDLYFVQEYAGEPITSKTRPPDWKSQAEDILNELRRYGVTHGDLTPRNILVKDGYMRFIDPWNDRRKLGYKDSDLVKFLCSGQFRDS